MTWKFVEYSIFKIDSMQHKFATFVKHLEKYTYKSMGSWDFYFVSFIVSLGLQPYFSKLWLPELPDSCFLVYVSPYYLVYYNVICLIVYCLMSFSPYQNVNSRMTRDGSAINSETYNKKTKGYLFFFSQLGYLHCQDS